MRLAKIITGAVIAALLLGIAQAQTADPNCVGRVNRGGDDVVCVGQVLPAPDKADPEVWACAFPSRKNGTIERADVRITGAECVARGGQPRAVSPWVR